MAMRVTRYWCKHHAHLELEEGHVEVVVHLLHAKTLRERRLEAMVAVPTQQSTLGTHTRHSISAACFH